jgi:hypothetical protein
MLPTAQKRVEILHYQVRNSTILNQYAVLPEISVRVLASLSVCLSVCLSIYSSAESLYFETGWSKLEDRRKSRKLNLFYKIENNMAPTYVSDCLPTTIGETVTCFKLQTF